MTQNRDMFESIVKRSWMIGLSKRAQNVIAAYGEHDPTFNKNKLIAAIKSGDFPKRAVNAGPVLTEEIKKYLGIEIETIVGVASKAYGKLYQLPNPYRHHDLLDIMYKERGGKEQVCSDEDGFITSYGRYVNRKQAYIIAVAANQLLKGRHHNGQKELYSESVW